MNRTSAIVIGASMGGLAAAAAVAPHFDRVLVLDRDELPAEPRPRRGVPQGRHAHGIQPGGIRALDALLPGLLEELVAAGVPHGDISADANWYIGGGRFARGTTDTISLGFTRPFLEHTVRARVAALPNVEIEDGIEVVRPTYDGTRVTGLEVRLAGGDATTTTVDADLVIDCTGKVSKLPGWLAELGFAPPAEQTVHCKMAYLSARWRLAADNDCMGSDIVAVCTPADTPHFGVIIAQEDGSYIVTLGGLLDGAPARNFEAYRSFAAELPDRRIADALSGATPVTDLQPSHFPVSKRRRYDRLRSFPPGLLALGDSIAAFNPMYGQGMSVAALEAVALRDALAAGRFDARKYFKRAHKIADVAWKISTGGDLRFPEVDGTRTPDAKIMNRYLDRIALAARTDTEVAAAFLAVAGFLKRPESLFAPSLVLRVLRVSTAARSAPDGSRQGDALSVQCNDRAREFPSRRAARRTRRSGRSRGPRTGVLRAAS